MFLYCPLQVDNNQGLLLKSEREESLPQPAESLLKRQTATAHLKSQYQASVRQKRANLAKQNVPEQREEVKGARLSSQTSFQTNGYHHQPYTQTHLLPQPYSNLQAHSRTSTLPLYAGIDRPEVCCVIFQHTAFLLCIYIDAPVNIFTTYNV